MFDRKTAVLFQDAPKTTFDVEKTMSDVEKIISDIEKTISDLFICFTNA